jgi:hypothetical protein
VDGNLGNARTGSAAGATVGTASTTRDHQRQRRRQSRSIYSLGLGSLAATWVAAEKYLNKAATALTISEAIDPQLASAVENCLLVADIAQANT